MCIFLTHIEFLLQFTLSFSVIHPGDQSGPNHDTGHGSIFTAALEKGTAPFDSEGNTVTVKLWGHCPLSEPWPCPGGRHVHLLPSICLPWGPEEAAGSRGALGFDACFCHWLCLDSLSREQG